MLASSGCVPPFSLDRVIFPTRRKEVSDDEIVHKTFIISSGSFAFGPLHCGRPRERLDVVRAQNWGACVCHVGSIDLTGKGFFYTKKWDENCVDVSNQPKGIFLRSWYRRALYCSYNSQLRTPHFSIGIAVSSGA